MKNIQGLSNIMDLILHKGTSKKENVGSVPGGAVTQRRENHGIRRIILLPVSPIDGGVGIAC